MDGPTNAHIRIFRRGSVVHHPTTQTGHQSKVRLRPNIVFQKSATTLQRFAMEHQMTLGWKKQFFTLNLGSHTVDGIQAVHTKRDCYVASRLDKDLKNTTSTHCAIKRFMIGAPLAEVVVTTTARSCARVFDNRCHTFFNSDLYYLRSNCEYDIKLS